MRCVIFALIIFIACSSFGCHQARAANNAAQSQFVALSDSEKKQLAQKRATIEHYLGDQASKEKYKTVAGKLGTIRALLDAHKFKPDQIYELQALGVVLGDAFVQEMRMQWIIFQDKDGRDAAIRMPGTSIVIFPQTMILKRVERGENVDVFDLFNATVSELERIKKQAR